VGEISHAIIDQKYSHESIVVEKLLSSVSHFRFSLNTSVQKSSFTVCFCGMKSWCTNSCIKKKSAVTSHCNKLYQQYLDTEIMDCCIERCVAMVSFGGQSRNFPTTHCVP